MVFRCEVAMNSSLHLDALGTEHSFDLVIRRLVGVVPTLLQAMFDATPSWRCEVEPIAITGRRFALTRNRYRDTAEAGAPDLCVRLRS